jgi:protein-S-isoprenylcysteine O-methyltransferase Ste14
MPWVRGLIFTFLVPAVIGFFVPMFIDARAQQLGGLWSLGWLFIGVGTSIYTVCFIRFLMAGGTPAIFFTRGLKLLIGEEPTRLVSEGLYRFSRNPMYVGVLIVIFGQAIFRGSPVIALYGFVVFVCFHTVVVFVEEPHLRQTYGIPYELYCKNVPRWF